MRDEPTGEPERTDQGHEQAEYLRARVTTLAGDVAECTTALARVLDQAAAVRPHDADRLRDAARRARSHAVRMAGRARQPGPTRD